MRKTVSFAAVVVLIATGVVLSLRNVEGQDTGTVEPVAEVVTTNAAPAITTTNAPTPVPVERTEDAGDETAATDEVEGSDVVTTNVTDAVDLTGDPTAGTTGIVEATVDEEADLISVTLNDVPLTDVVKMFTRISGANIIATSSNLQGTVTANLTDVAWYPAMTTILKEHNLTLEKSPDAEIYRIVPVPADAPEPQIVRTMFLKYTTVPEILPVIKGILIAEGMVQGFPSRNALVVRSTAQNLSDVETLLMEIDVQSKQVCIETKFLEISDEAGKKLGIRWDSLDEFGVKLQAGPYSTQTDVTRNKSRVDTYTRWHDRATVDTVKEEFDRYGDQVDSSGGFHPNPEGGFDQGAFPARVIADTIDSGEETERKVIDTFNKAIQESQAAILEVDSLNVVLSALKKTDGVSIISNPKILVDNGATNATIKVGRREPIIRVEVQRGTQDRPGDKETAELATEINTDFITEGYLETGMNLQVVPVVKTDDLIEARINPSLRRWVADKEVAGNSWPIVDVKEISTQFTLRSGQTVAIGGLIDTADSKRTSRIPVLGSIPLVGKYLFSHDEDFKSQIELIIFVTLSLAQPDTLFEESGIPDEAKLIHQRMIQTRAEQQQFQQDLEQIKTVVGDGIPEPVREAQE